MSNRLPNGKFAEGVSGNPLGRLSQDQAYANAKSYLDKAKRLSFYSMSPSTRAKYLELMEEIHIYLKKADDQNEAYLEVIQIIAKGMAEILYLRRSRSRDS